MKRKIITTEDGSHTLYIPEMDEHYHSTHGAIQESKHIYINSGLKATKKRKLNVFEVGLGTGLNALLTIIEAEKTGTDINYISIEKYPLSSDEYSKLNYSQQINGNFQSAFDALHSSDWDVQNKLSAHFELTKIKADITTLDLSQSPLFDLIYFDAFAPNKQLNIWDRSVFEKIYKQCSNQAILVTYCAKGEVRRNLQSVGFKVERLQGPPGKREILRAIK